MLRIPYRLRGFRNQAHEYKDDDFQGRDSSVKICNVHESKYVAALEANHWQTSSKEKHACLFRKLFFEWTTELRIASQFR